MSDVVNFRNKGNSKKVKHVEKWNMLKKQKKYGRIHCVFA